MHLAVEPDILDHLAAIGFEGAAIIVQWHAQQDGNQPIGDDRREPAGQSAVLPRAAPAGDDVIALGELGDKPWNVGWIVLPVGIHWDDHVARAVLNRRHQGGGLAVVARQMQHPDPRIAAGNAVEGCRRAVPRPVIGKNDLRRLRQPVEHVGQRAIQFGQRAFFVVDRNDDRNVHLAPSSRR